MNAVVRGFNPLVTTKKTGLSRLDSLRFHRDPSRAIFSKRRSIEPKGICSMFKRDTNFFFWKMIACFLCVTAVLIFTGCGTISSLQEDWEFSGYNARPSTIIYSGVRCEAHNFMETGDCPVPGLFRTILIVDIPLSICADTICLPYTIYRRLTECHRFYQVVDVTFFSTGVQFIWLENGDPRDTMEPLDAICARLRQVNGKPHSVWVNISADTEVSVTDYGKIFETIRSNKTLRLANQHPKIETPARQYLTQKKTTFAKEMAGQQSVPLGSILAGCLTGIFYIASILLIILDIKKRQAHILYCSLCVFFGSVGYLIWLVVRPQNRGVRNR
jgi:uncharacterized protein YceK